MKQGKELLSIGLGLVLGLVAIPVLAVERVPVSDAAMLARMGLSPDAQNVYMLTNVPQRDDAADFGIGIGNTHYTAIAGSTFQGRRTAAGPTWQYVADNFTLQPAFTEQFAQAEFQLPSGAEFTGVRWWASDTNAASDLAVFIYSTCLPNFAAGSITTTVLGSADPATTGATGNQSALISLSTTVDTTGCTYQARVRFDSTSGIVLQKVRAQWNRQVSPAPAIASFTDVPTGHPFYAFIEALKASAVTLGCTATTYCPNNPVTRGEMAAFLARALGLYFP